MTEADREIQAQIQQVLASMCGHLDQRLTATMPDMEWATVFWTRGEHHNPLANIIFARTPNDPKTLTAIETAVRATRDAANAVLVLTASKVIDAVTQAEDGTWIIGGDGESLVSELANVLDRLGALDAQG